MMQTLLSLLTGYAALPAKDKKLRLDIIVDQKNIVPALFDYLNDDSAEKDVKRSALSVLCDLANKEKFKKKIFDALSPALLESILNADDPKLRKSAAKLLGQANSKRYAGALIRALKREETEFVLDSLILSLGYTDYSKEAYDFLCTYHPKSSEEKHRAKETLALQKALSSLKKTEPLDDVLLCGTNVLLTYPEETPDALKDELLAAGASFTESFKISNALEIKPEHYTDVFAFRCFFEALIDLGEYDRDKEHSFISEVFAQIHSLLKLDAYQIRFDLRYLNPAEKASAMEALVASTLNTAFSSSPSNYQLELRLIFQKNTVSAFACVPSLDTRFAYRKTALPASINPVIAANMMRTILPYLTPDATVLDPFCGTGTLLYERDSILPCEELVGVDMMKDAIYKAKTNFLNEDIPIAFLVSDILDADLNQEFDEIISNMPFGRRVSDTKQNETLYTRFFQQLKTLLKVGGYAFLYTNQKTLLKNLVKGDMKFVLEKEILFEAGGLFPTLFVIKRIR